MERGGATIAEIFDREFSYVVRSLRRLGVHEGDLDDVAQDVFLSVYRSLDGYDPERPIRPWLFAFAFRHASNYRRLARHRRETAPAADEPPGKEASPEEQASRAEERALVLAALGAIELDRRSILVMHDIDGIPAPEISEALGVKLNTVYSRLRLGRRDFERAVRRAQAGEGSP